MIPTLVALSLLGAPAAMPARDGRTIASIVRRAEASEYGFTPDDLGRPSAPNRAHGWRVAAEAGDLVVRPRCAPSCAAGGGWSLSLRGAGAGGWQGAGGSGAAGLRRTGAGVSETMANDASGLRYEAAAASPAHPLRLTVVAGGLTVEAASGAHGPVRLVRDGAVVASVAMSAFDGTGRPAPVGAALNADGIGMSVEADAADFPLKLSVVLTGGSWDSQGFQEGGSLGWSVAGAGDVDGDGFDDVLLGSPNYDRGQIDEGRVFLHLGSAEGLSATAAWTAEGNQSYAAFGIAVAGAGDVNGDGFDDLLVGASVYDNGQPNEGAAFLWLGGPGGPGRAGKPSNAAWAAEGNQPGAFFGYAVSSAGDVNADGFDDVVVGGWGHDRLFPDEGRAALFLGSAAGPGAAPGWVVHGGQAAARLGFSCRGAGDVDGDGFDDLLVGAPYHDGLVVDGGRLMLFRGTPSGPEEAPSWEALGGFPYGELGYSVAGAGDVNGDGFADLLAGERGRADPDPREGAAMVFLGSASGPVAAPAWVSSSDSPYALFGYSVAGAGDVNGDGYDDVLVGADGYSGDFYQEGRAYLYLGSPLGLGPSAAWTVEGGSHHAFLGRSVAGAGDVNGDGLADVVVGADGDPGGGAGSGKVLLFTGSR